MKSSLQAFDLGDPVIRNVTGHWHDDEKWGSSCLNHAAAPSFSQKYLHVLLQVSPLGKLHQTKGPLAHER